VREELDSVDGGKPTRDGIPKAQIDYSEDAKRAEKDRRMIVQKRVAALRSGTKPNHMT